MTPSCPRYPHFTPVEKLNSRVGFAITIPLRLLTPTILEGDLSIHLAPAIQIGVQVLRGAVIDAQVWAIDKLNGNVPDTIIRDLQAYVQTDLYAGISINASASESQVSRRNADRDNESYDCTKAPQACYNACT